MIKAKILMVDSLILNMKLSLKDALKIAEITEEQYNEYKVKQK